MKCQKCSTENKKHAKFCVKCGAPLKQPEKKINLKIAGILIVIAVIIIIALSSYFLLSSAPENNDTIKTSYPTVEVDGVTWTIPYEGYFKEYNKYRFSFTNHSCSLKSVESFEKVPEDKTIDSVKMSKYYPGAETYVSHYTSSGETWHGMKIKKDGVWFHVSMRTTDEQTAIEFFDWMYNHNDWEGHE